MKRILPLLLLALSATASYAAAIGTPGYLDDANGFRDVRFGASLDSFTGLEEAGALSTGRQCYTRSGDELQAGEARLSKLRYCFLDRRLWAVVLDSVGTSNSGALLDFMTETYGQGDVELGSGEGSGDRRVWHGKSTEAVFGEVQRGMGAQVRLWSTELERTVARERQYREYDHDGHAHHDPRPLALQGRAEFSLNVPQHARPGLTVQLMMRYRNLGTPGRVRIDLPAAMRVVQTVPAANVEPGGAIVWSGLDRPTGSLKIKAQIHPQAEVGRALLIRADVADASGGRQQERATIHLR